MNKGKLSTVEQRPEYVAQRRGALLTSARCLQMGEHRVLFYLIRQPRQR